MQCLFDCTDFAWWIRSDNNKAKNIACDHIFSRKNPQYFSVVTCCLFQRITVYFFCLFYPSFSDCRNTNTIIWVLSPVAYGLGISLRQVTFVWLAFAGTLNLLTHFAVIISSHHIMYIFHLCIISCYVRKSLSLSLLNWQFLTISCLKYK